MPISGRREVLGDSAGARRQANLFGMTPNRFADFITAQSQPQTNPSLQNPVPTSNPTPTGAPDFSNPKFINFAGYAPNQHADAETANRMAGYLGGTVNQTQPGGPVAPPPQNLIEFDNGLALNAGLVASLYQKYPKHVADAMVQAERANHQKAIQQTFQPTPAPPPTNTGSVTPPPPTTTTPPPATGTGSFGAGLNNPQLKSFIDSLLGGGGSSAPQNPLQLIAQMLETNVPLDSLMQLMALMPAMQSFLGMLQPQQQEQQFWYTRPRFRLF